MLYMHHLRAALGERSAFYGTGAVWKEDGGFDGGSSAWSYLLLLGYIAICLYIYIGIVLFFYCFIACLKHGGYYFLYIYILFLFLTSTSIFYDNGCRLSIIWLFTVQRYGGSVRYQTPGDALFG